MCLNLENSSLWRYSRPTFYSFKIARPSETTANILPVVVFWTCRLKRLTAKLYLCVLLFKWVRRIIGAVIAQLQQHCSRLLSHGPSSLAMCTCVYAGRASALIGWPLLWRSHCIIPPLELVWGPAAGTREASRSASRWPSFAGKELACSTWGRVRGGADTFKVTVHSSTINCFTATMNLSWKGFIFNKTVCCRYTNRLCPECR